MPKREDLTPDLNRLMDKAGLTGAMYDRRKSFMKIVLDVRQSLLAEMKAYINERDQRFIKEIKSLKNDDNF